MSEPDPRIDEALDLLRSALVSIKTALQKIGEARAEMIQKTQEEAPKFFGRKAPDTRPTTAVGAESHESEG